MSTGTTGGKPGGGPKVHGFSLTMQLTGTGSPERHQYVVTGDPATAAAIVADYYQTIADTIRAVGLPPDPGGKRATFKAEMKADGAGASDSTITIDSMSDASYQAFKAALVSSASAKGYDKFKSP